MCAAATARMPCARLSYTVVAPLGYPCQNNLPSSWSISLLLPLASTVARTCPPMRLLTSCRVRRTCIVCSSTSLASRTHLHPARAATSVCRLQPSSSCAAAHPHRCLAHAHACAPPHRSCARALYLNSSAQLPCAAPVSRAPRLLVSCSTASAHLRVRQHRRQLWQHCKHACSSKPRTLARLRSLPPVWPSCSPASHRTASAGSAPCPCAA